MTQPLQKDHQTRDPELDALLEKLTGLTDEIKKVILGQDLVIEQLLTGMLAGGHCLLRGVPGLAKTLMVRTLARTLDLSFRRIQFTPDLMPSDILGTEILEEDHTTGKRFFKFNRGPIFSQVLLADEINRTPPKTQAALLEAMEEKRVTYGGETYELEAPFFTLATMNPIEQSGTYPLPEAQLDRFQILIELNYPAEFDELAILQSTTGMASPQPKKVLEGPQITKAQTYTRQVHISDELLNYVNRLVRATRPGTSPAAQINELVRWGAGPRAGQALILTAKGRALLHGRLAVTLADIQALVKPVFRHRILLNFKGEAEGIEPDQLIDHLMATVTPPTSPLD